jgi:hypothetical protein
MSIHEANLATYGMGNSILTNGKFAIGHFRDDARMRWLGGLRMLPVDYVYRGSNLNRGFILDEKIPYDLVRTEISGTLEEFLADPNNKYWRDTVENIQITNNSLEVQTTGDIGTLFPFHQKQFNILRGRVFTEEEYAQGSKVCVVSEKLARENNLNLGDSLILQFYPGRYTAERQLQMINIYESSLTITDNYWFMPQSMPYEQFLPMTDQMAYEIIGIYQGMTGLRGMTVDWLIGDYAMGANTVIIPDNSVPYVPDILSPRIDENMYIPASNLYALSLDNHDADAFFRK